MEKFRLLAFVLLLTGCLSGEKISTIPFGISSGSDGGSGNSPISPKGGFVNYLIFLVSFSKMSPLKGLMASLHR